MSDTAEIVARALATGTTVPAFNIPYLPMMEPVVHALRDCRAFGLIMVARLEWEKFEAGSPRQIAEEYRRVGDRHHTRLHLDHVPVIDEDMIRVDYLTILREAMDLGYESIMVDGSRLSLEENIQVTREVVAMAHERHIAVEAELGAVFGHEAGPLPPYEELFRSGKGFTRTDEADRFVRETGVDWLSVSIGNVHGAISAATRGEKKVRARIDIDRLRALQRITGVPIVLHGGSGIERACLHEGIRNGIAKINIATTLRQAYEPRKDTSVNEAQAAVYAATCTLLHEELNVAGRAKELTGGEAPPFHPFRRGVHNV